VTKHGEKDFPNSLSQASIATLLASSSGQKLKYGTATEHCNRPITSSERAAWKCRTWYWRTITNKEPDTAGPCGICYSTHCQRKSSTALYSGTRVRHCLVLHFQRLGHIHNYEPDPISNYTYYFTAYVTANVTTLTLYVVLDTADYYQLLFTKG